MIRLIDNAKMRRCFALIALTVPSAAMAGTFTYNPGTWGSFTGSGAGNSSAFSSDPSAAGISPSVTITSPATGDSYTLGATYSFAITWTPAPGDTPLSSVVVTFHRQGTLTVDSTGVAEILNGATQLLEMDSTNDFLSGGTSNISDVSYTLPLVLQTNGSYLASGAITSDTLSTTFNSGSSVITTSQEIFTLYTMVAGS